MCSFKLHVKKLSDKRDWQIRRPKPQRPTQFDRRTSSQPTCQGASWPKHRRGQNPWTNARPPVWGQGGKSDPGNTSGFHYLTVKQMLGDKTLHQVPPTRNNFHQIITPSNHSPLVRMLATALGAENLESSHLYKNEGVLHRSLLI